MGQTGKFVASSLIIRQAAWINYPRLGGIHLLEKGINLPQRCMVIHGDGTELCHRIMHNIIEPTTLSSKKAEEELCRV